MSFFVIFVFSRIFSFSARRKSSSAFSRARMMNCSVFSYWLRAWLMVVFSEDQSALVVKGAFCMVCRYGIG